MTIYKLHQTCRACGYGQKPSAGGVKTGAGTERLVPVFDLGIQPLANDFANDNDERAGYAPLKVLFCPRCRLAQLSVVVRPDILYSRYLYVTSPSETMRHHFGQLGAALAAEQPFTSLLEIGSNDGTLLRYFAGQGVKVAGIDPAENLAELARKKGIPTVTGVFNHHTADLARAACRSGFDVILARHVFCHADNWREFISALSMASHRDTLVCIEVPYVKDLLERGEFDTIYHEHLSYLNIGAVEQLLDQSPFVLANVIRFPIHGGAIALLLRRRDHACTLDRSFAGDENISAETWQDFSSKALKNLENLRCFVAAARADGKRVCGFGASAKSTVWLNACGFSRQDLEFITDTTPQKLYRCSPGTDIPIVDPGAILRERPDYAICFCWNFRTEVLSQNEPAMLAGVKFVFPIPHLEVVGLDKDEKEAYGQVVCVANGQQSSG